MLSYPDRQKFEQIRARWETARPAASETVEMVGRREKQALPQTVSSEFYPTGASKFRRTLSHGLAFISNPLLQRKATPGRHQVNIPAPAVSEVISTAVSLSPTRISTSVERLGLSQIKPTTPTHDKSATISVDCDVSPKPLPRSRTFSFIPRPVKIDSEVTTTEVSKDIQPSLSAVLSEPGLRAMSSKIPTPSPPLSERRSSLRQHLPRHTSHPVQQITAAHSEAYNGSPVKFATRSRTTPNLVKGANQPRPTGFVAPKKTALRRISASPTTPKQMLQENIPSNKSVLQRRSQIQERSLKKESLAVPGTISHRRSLGPGALPRQNTLPYLATSPATRKRLSSHLAQQTPVPVKRDQSNEQADTRTTEPSQLAIEPSFMAPRLPPTRSLQTENIAPLALLRTSIEKDPQRKTLGTPNGLGGVWRSSRALAAANHEVRTVPRSSTFHDFGSQIPPVPLIPERFKTPSFPNLTTHSHMMPGTPRRPPQMRVVSDVNSFKSNPEESGESENDCSVSPTPHGIGHNQPYPINIPNSSESSVVLAPVPSTICSLKPAQEPHTTVDSRIHRPGGCINRPWSISESQDCADLDPYLQVKDYMPPLYWAGRFQSRIDQWRTEAMIAELNPNKCYESTSPLSECKLAQEKLAACYILGQLRDLCTSNQAADSLWEFEYQYRKDNKLLGNPLDLPAVPSRKDDYSTHSGAFGRAVRKLTPRKASLVNLLKGKGWNKSEETRPNEGPDQTMDTSSGDS